MLAVGVALVLATVGGVTSATAAGAGTARAAAGVAAAPALPDSMAAIGDSITQAVDICCFYGTWPGHSWSTGYVPLDGIASHYERIRAQNPAIRGHRWNNAVSGAQMADAPGQARRTVDQGAQYVTVLMGANDLCAWDGALTPTATFRAQFTETLDILRPGCRAPTCSWPRSRTSTSSGASSAPTRWPRSSGRPPASARRCSSSSTRPPTVRP